MKKYFVILKIIIEPILLSWLALLWLFIGFFLPIGIIAYIVTHIK